MRVLCHHDKTSMFALFEFFSEMIEVLCIHDVVFFVNFVPITSDFGIPNIKHFGLLVHVFGNLGVRLQKQLQRMMCMMSECSKGK